MIQRLHIRSAELDVNMMSSILCEVTDDGKYCEYAEVVREMKRVKGVLRELAFRFPPPRTKRQANALLAARAILAEED